MNKLYLLVAALALFAFAYLAFFNKPASQPTPQDTITVQPTQEQTQQPESPSSSPSAKASENVITFTDTGYSPKKITIKTGAGVTFKNTSTNATWPASAMHPTHRVYPGSDIAKCGTAQQSTIFDACQGIFNGQDWSFTFTEKGTWNYHDHLNPQHFGTILVE